MVLVVPASMQCEMEGWSPHSRSRYLPCPGACNVPGRVVFIVADATALQSGPRCQPTRPHLPIFQSNWWHTRLTTLHSDCKATDLPIFISISRTLLSSRHHLVFQISSSASDFSLRASPSHGTYLGTNTQSLDTVPTGSLHPTAAMPHSLPRTKSSAQPEHPTYFDIRIRHR